jgi:ATP-dependent RNA helicase RhlE
MPHQRDNTSSRPRRPTYKQPKPQESLSEARGRSMSRPVKNIRPKQKQKVMDADYNLLIKKAKPQAIADFTPTKSFVEHGLHEKIIDNLNKKGYTQPTPIQDQAIPHLMDGNQDILGIANTGTGKTAAFLLPLIHQVYENRKKCILVLAPTRELAIQIQNELKTFTNHGPVSSTIIIGGENIDKQINALRKRLNFIIATTGRGLDLIERGELRIKDVDTVVLDEMDQMLDMGFVRDIRKILSLATNNKHLLFFSATMSKDIEKIALEILNKPVTVSVVQGTTTDNVEQDVIEVRLNENKFDKLCDLLSRKEVDKVILFENTKHGASRLEKDLQKRGFKAVAIHGNKNQNQRRRALDAFKAGSIDILIATNVAARGLDIPKVSHVINYGLPQSKEDYVHRIGRTGRAGETGHAYTFVNVDK